jgi:hypothetical protein
VAPRVEDGRGARAGFEQVVARAIATRVVHHACGSTHANSTSRTGHSQ